LVVDATQGVEAQTLSNTFMAIENNLFLVLAINKIDLPSADVQKTLNDVETSLEMKFPKYVPISAKSGLNVEQLLDLVIEQIPSPFGKSNKKTKALIFDSYFDEYKGVVCLVRIFDGELKLNQKIKLMNANKEYIISELGIKTPLVVNKDVLTCGEVG